MPGPRVVLVHGTAVTPAVWDPLLAALARMGVGDAVAVDRPSSGDLAVELESLAPSVEGALVVGVSGGATLCLALAASPIRLAGAIAHEPAVGSLLPELLAPVAEAFASGGAHALGRALYGPAWDPSMCPDEAPVARDLGMFRGFEPGPPGEGQGPVLVTTGLESPAVRHLAAARLHAAYGYAVTTIAGARHFAQWDNPEELAGLVAATRESLGAT